MKVSEIQKALPALQALSGCQLPAKAAYRVAKTIKKLDQIMRPINKQHHELILKHGTKDEASGATSVSQESMDAFMAEVNVLTETEVDMAEVFVIPLDLLGDAKLEPGMIAMLMGWLIVDTEDVDKSTLHDEGSV